MITATPSTCQPTEMLLSSASSLSPKMFSTVTNAEDDHEQGEGLASTPFVSAKFTPRMSSS